VAETLKECLRCLEGAFCWHTLIQQDRNQERERVSPEEGFRRLRRRESSRLESAAELEHCSDHVRLASESVN
jgi:hypothetical protein